MMIFMNTIIAIRFNLPDVKKVFTTYMSNGYVRYFLGKHEYMKSSEKAKRVIFKDV